MFPFRIKAHEWMVQSMYEIRLPYNGMQYSRSNIR